MHESIKCQTEYFILLLEFATMPEISEGRFQLCG